MENVDQLHMWAYHESGHCFMGRQLGMRIRSVNVLVLPNGEVDGGVEWATEECSITTDGKRLVYAAGYGAIYLLAKRRAKVKDSVAHEGAWQSATRDKDYVPECSDEEFKTFCQRAAELLEDHWAELATCAETVFRMALERLAISGTDSRIELPAKEVQKLVDRLLCLS